MRLEKHLASIHKNEPDVKRLISSKDKKARETLISLLRRRGNHENNVKSVKNGHGYLHVSRTPADGSGDISDFSPCNVCLLWVSRSRLRRHKCMGDTAAAEKPSMAKSKELLTAAKYKVSPAMAQTLGGLAADRVGNTVRDDKLLMAVLCMKSMSGKSHHQQWHDQMRLRLRYGGRLLIEMRQILHNRSSSSTLAELLCPENFDTMVEATKRGSVANPLQKFRP
jgi:hypothetical protein